MRPGYPVGEIVLSVAPGGAGRFSGLLRARGREGAASRKAACYAPCVPCSEPFCFAHNAQVRERRIAVTVAALIAAALAAAIAPARDEELHIPQVETSLAGRDVRVSAQLAPGLPPDALKRLASGLPTTVAWELRLFVSRDKWWDSLKDERQYAVTATYRAVSGDTAVERRLDGRLLETVVLPEREEAERALTTLPALPSFTMGPHLVGKPLVVRVRCLYGTDVALGFVPTRTMTDWRRSPVFFWQEGGEAP